MLTKIRKKLAEVVAECCPLEATQVMSVLEIPKQFEHGHLALPVFSLARELRQAPPQIAVDLAQKIRQNQPDFLARVEAVKGFVNFTFAAPFMQEQLMEAVSASGGRLGHSQRGAGQTLAIDYSSPNVAKPMSIGHLRATVIGQALRNLAHTQGYTVLGINHLGDWGVQFGKLAWAFQNWGDQYPFAEKPFEALFQLYVRFHEEAEKNSQYDEWGAQTFQKLEQGDPEVEAIWKMFLEISLKEYQRLWDLLGVQHDLVRGESFYNDRLAAVEKRIEEAGLLEESEGAMVVKLDEASMPPCLIRKSDGASLYATRDLAGAIYRREELHADLNLYVVGMDQSLHFKQIFAVLEKMGYAWAETCHHISFGMYRFKEGRMSTRKGNVIFLEDVLRKAIELVRETIEAKNPDLENKERVAQQVGVGAVIFNDLINDRVRNVDFDWQRVLDFEGHSGPYVQYCQVRAHSLLNKYGRPPAAKMATVLASPEEQELIHWLLQYEDVLASAFENFKPNTLAQYLLEVCRLFNHFYQKNRILGGGDKDLESARISLVFATREVLRAGLKVLNIESPEAM